MNSSDTSGWNLNDYRNPGEVKLIEGVISGEKDAIEHLFEKYRGKIIRISNKYVDNQILNEKLIDVGNRGLIKAAHRFHSTKGFNFSAYAAWWIRKFFVKELNA